jgi:hypothetical protein
MKKRIILGVAVLAVSAPVWATLPYPTSQIGLCNPILMCGGCVPTPCPIPSPCPCPVPTPCPPCGSCQVTSCIMVINNCLMSGPCGVVGMQNYCAMNSQIGCNPCVPPAVMQCMAGMNVNGHNMALAIGIP